VFFSPHGFKAGECPTYKEKEEDVKNGNSLFSSFIHLQSRWLGWTGMYYMKRIVWAC
jgi:hypothetical protein